MTLEEYYNIPLKIGDLVHVIAFNRHKHNYLTTGIIINKAKNPAVFKIKIVEINENRGNTVIRRPADVWKIPPELLV